MSRLERLDENRLASEVDAIERTLQELKASRQIIGGSSIVHYVTQLPGDYDWQGHIPDDGSGYGMKEFLVEATADSMDFLWSNIEIFIFTGSPPVRYLGDSIFADEIAGNNPFLTSVYEVPNVVDNDRVSTSYLTVEGPAGISAPLLSVKFKITALDTVGISITELN